MVVILKTNQYLLIFSVEHRWFTKAMAQKKIVQIYLDTDKDRLLK